MNYLRLLFCLFAFTVSVGCNSNSNSESNEVSDQSTIQIKTETTQCNKSLYVAGKKSFEESSYLDAIQLLEIFLRGCSSEKVPSAWISYSNFMLGYSYEQLLLNADPGDKNSNDLRGYAIQYYNLYLNSEPHSRFSVRALEGEARVLATSTDVGERKKGLEIIARGLDMDPARASLYRVKGNILTNLKEYGLACEAYKTAASYEPGNAWNHLGLGTAFAYVGECEKAIDAYEKALSIDPNLEQAKTSLKWAKDFCQKK